jgi:hypothetical protein
MGTFAALMYMTSMHLRECHRHLIFWFPISSHPAIEAFLVNMITEALNIVGALTVTASALSSLLE